MIRFRCPKCDSQMEVDESFAGRPARCPTCGVELRVPKAETPRADTLGPGHPGATAVRVGDEIVEVSPPVETMAIVSLVFVAGGVAATVLITLFLGDMFFLPAWVLGMAVGAALALLGALTGLPAYHTIRRSRGLKRGRLLALIGMLGGAAVFLVCVAGAIVGFARHRIQQHTCEENLQAVYAALEAYAKDHDGVLVPRSLEDLARKDYLDSMEYLTCPAYRVRLGTVTYVLYVSEPLPRLNDPRFPPDLMIVSDGPPHNAHRDGEVRVLQLNGEIRRVPAGKWASYQNEQRRIRHDIAQEAADRARLEAAGVDPDE